MLAGFTPGNRIKVQFCQGSASGSRIGVGVAADFCWDVGLGVGVKLSARRLEFDIVWVVVDWPCLVL